MAVPPEAKEAMMKALEEWLEEPGNTLKLIFECNQGMTPRGPARIFTVKGEGTFQQHVTPLAAPTIVQAGAVPPGMPSPFGPNGPKRG